MFDEYGEAYLYPGADMSGANLSGADARGADLQLATFTGADTNNMIQPNGRVSGLDLTRGQTLVVRDYDGNATSSPPISALPVVVDEHLTMDASSTLRLEFDADSWNSSISFEPGIPVALGGTLELTFAPGVDVATQRGRTLDLFNWAGVTPLGAFTVEDSAAWDLSRLYTTGEVTLLSIAMPGDANGDNRVDRSDLALVAGNFGLTEGALWSDGDFDGNGRVNLLDLGILQSNLGVGTSASRSAAVPEPASWMLGIVGIVCVVLTHRIAGLYRLRRDGRNSEESLSPCWIKGHDLALAKTDGG